MNLRKLRSRFALASGIGGAALACTMMLGGGVASAITIPPYPTYGVYPTWLTTNGTVSHIDRASGSDTTFYMMQQLADEYNQAGLYGCTLVGSGATQNSVCDNTTGGPPNESNVTTTDTTDNFDSNEVLMGENDIGSTNGQQQLCGYIPTPEPVDFARSSKPIASNANCANPAVLRETGYAKDSVPVTDFQNINPAAFGSASGYVGHTFTAPHQSFVSPAFPAGGIGPVAAGWLPGDPTNCVAAGTGSPACSGTALTDVDGGTGTGATSVVYRLWCATDATRITDWGQLSNLSAANNGGVAQSVGNGKPIGVPIRIIGVNKGSGTVATFNAFANSGVSGGGCSASPFNNNAASGQNPFTSDGYTGNPEIALENNAGQIGDFAAANWPNDPADQAVDIATSLYFEGLGYYDTIPHAGTAVITPGTGTVPSGVPTAYTVSLTSESNPADNSDAPISPSILHERSNLYPTSRTLFNIYRTDTIRASAGGFLNWVCDTNPTNSPGGLETKGLDQLYGGNFDSDITNTINATFGFSRLTDAASELSQSAQTPADGLLTPNATCDAQLTVSTQSGVTTVTNLVGGVAAPVPAAVQPTWVVSGNQGGNLNGIPAGDTVQSVSGNTITLTTAPTATGTITLYFPGKPPVMSVADPNS